MCLGARSFDLDFVPFGGSAVDRSEFSLYRSAARSLEFLTI
jgi:hypothetical protein